jgi:hypothetical protein
MLRRHPLGDVWVIPHAGHQKGRAVTWALATFNERIEERPKVKPALFLHIQKTAGTSVQEIARAHYGNDAVCSHGDFLTIGQTGCRTHDFVSGHFGIHFAKPLLKGRYAFTFLRDPVSRIVSLYSYLSKQPADQGKLAAVAARHDLKGFVMRARDTAFAPHIWNHQVWQLYHGWVSFDMGQDKDGRYTTTFIGQDEDSLLEGARANLALFDHVGFAESFNGDIRRIFKDLGAAEIEVPQSNASASPSVMLDSETRAAIEEMTALDRQLYEFARAARAQ